MTDFFYKVTKNIVPSICGFIFYSKSLLRKDVNIIGVPRIAFSSLIGFHPGSKVKIGRSLLIGRNVTISVLSKGNLDIGTGIGIGNNNQIVCHNHILIGDNTMFGPNVMIYDHNHQFNFEDGVDRNHFRVGEVTIGEKCWIGANVVILNNVHIGDNCVIGAGSVVTKDIPSYSIAVGNPAKVIKSKNELQENNKKPEYTLCHS